MGALDPAGFGVNQIWQGRAGDGQVVAEDAQGSQRKGGLIHPGTASLHLQRGRARESKASSPRDVWAAVHGLGGRNGPQG